MNIQKILIIWVLVMSVAGSTLAGEPLSAETVLPLQGNKDGFKPSAAFLGGSYLVAWKSGILAPGDLREGFKYNSDIVACLVGKNGEVLSKEPFVISKAKGLQDMPQVAATRLRPEGNGTSPGQDVALVVWQDLRNGKDWDTYGALISKDGKILAPDGLATPKPAGEGGFLIAGGEHNQGKPRVAWDGKTFVVVWMDFRSGNGYEAYAARVQADGKLLDPQGIKVSIKGGTDVAISSMGDGKSVIISSGGVGWTPQRKLLTVSMGFFADGVFTPAAYDGEPQSTDPNTYPGGRNTPVFIAAGKDSYLVSWRSERWVSRGQGSSKCTGMMFGSKGDVTARIQLEGAPHLVLAADMVWDGSAFVAAWAEFRWAGKYGYKEVIPNVGKEGVLASRISPDGSLIGPALVVSDVPKVPSTNPCVASDGAGTTLIAYEKQPATGDVPIQIAFRMLTAEKDVSSKP